jgi:hypothetical protein
VYSDRLSYSRLDHSWLGTVTVTFALALTVTLTLTVTATIKSDSYSPSQG